VIRQRGEGEMFPGIPNIAQEEFDFGETDSLMLEIQAFLDSVRNGTPAKVDGAAGRDAVHTAQRITDSLRAHRRLLEQSGVI
jgi:predicted dehydrogenase